MAGSGMKSLAKDTAIYGLSSIVGRFLNWCLTPLYVYTFTNPVEYGKMSNIFGYTALLLVLLTYGMETGFFRFMNKKEEDAPTVYSTSLITLGTTSLLFILLCFAFISPISSLLEYPNHKEYILMMAIVVALDAFMTIPYAYLRYQKRPIKFMTIKMIFIFSNILFNLVFLLGCPWLYKNYPDLVINKLYNPDFGIGYIFLANLLSSLIVLLSLLPTIIKGINFRFDNQLVKRMLKYSFPLLILGIAGVINQAVASLTYPYLFEDKYIAFNQLGIYNACLKITVIITMFTQAFRYAYEPFFFGRDKDGGSTKPYADAMKFFVIFSLLVFLAVMFYMDILKYIVSANYTEGVVIIPIAMIGEIFFGIYFNLSVWYKLTDKTKYGAWFSILGCLIQLSINIIFVPIYGYIASAWATFICNLLIMTISYFFGRKYFPISYDLKKIFAYFILTAVVYAAAMYPIIDNEVLRLAYRTLLLLAFGAIIIKNDLPLSEIPVIGKRFGKK